MMHLVNRHVESHTLREFDLEHLIKLLEETLVTIRKTNHIELYEGVQLPIRKTTQTSSAASAYDARGWPLIGRRDVTAVISELIDTTSQKEGRYRVSWQAFARAWELIEGVNTHLTNRRLP